MPAWAVVIIVLLLLALGLRIFAEVAFRSGFTWDRDVSKTEKINIDRIRRSPHPEGEAKVLTGRDWLLARESREVEITSFDGLALRARLYPCDRTLAGEETVPCCCWPTASAATAPSISAAAVPSTWSWASTCC